METLDTILSRRSIRKYRCDRVEDEYIDEALHAAMAAPSAGNEQPWHFIVIQNREMMLKINQVHPHSDMLQHASVAIVVCGDLSCEKYAGYWVQDCSAATQNILLALATRKIGSVWLGVYPDSQRIEGIKALFTLPSSIIPFSVVSIGYPKEEKERANRYDKNRIHYEKW